MAEEVVELTLAVEEAGSTLRAAMEEDEMLTEYGWDRSGLIGGKFALSTEVDAAGEVVNSREFELLGKNDRQSARVLLS
jgi:hypothetical protein